MLTIDSLRSETFEVFILFPLSHAPFPFSAAYKLQLDRLITTANSISLRVSPDATASEAEVNFNPLIILVVPSIAYTTR